MKLQVNGELKIIEQKSESSNLIKIIKGLGFNTKLIVVEFNGTILNPQKWESQKVRDGDIIEIVTIVGGG